MTLGEKIRKYRQLRGLTQKELGEAVGFSTSTSDSRIRKYELDVMAPKAETLSTIAKVLNIDKSLLNKNDLNENMLVTLFELQDKLKFDIKVIDDQVHFVLPMMPETDNLYVQLRKRAEYNKQIGSVSLIDENSDQYIEYLNWNIENTK